MSNFAKLMQQAAAGVGGDFYAYTIDNSCRFVGSDNAYLSKTFSTTPDSRTTCTISVWVKLTGKRNGNGVNTLWGTASNWEGAFFVEPSNTNGWRSDQIRVAGMSVTQPTLRTTSVYRDYSGWFNFITVWDSSNATAADRQRLYINGVRLTDFDQQVTASLNQQLQQWLSTTGATYIGLSGAATSQSFDGYIADFVCLDGTAASPTDLGEDKNGVWVPKDPSGLTFGTNGFWLDFADSANLGNDVSGNNNDFTTSGLTSADQMIDTPTNNFATLNPLASSARTTLSEGNLVSLGNNSSEDSVDYSTIAVTSGKWYWEEKINAISSAAVYPCVGVARIIKQPSNGLSTGNASGGGVGYFRNGNVQKEGSSVATYATFTTNDVIGVALDLDNLEISFYKNGTLQGTVTGLTSSIYYMSNTNYYNSQTTTNFGQTSFTYTAPAGFKTLCTANLPEPTIGPNSDTLSGENFNTVLYTGTGSAQSITGVGFQPDMLWFKSRSSAYNHALYDAVRGRANSLLPNATNAEQSAASNADLVSFDSDGMSLGIVEDNSSVNRSGESIVSWAWKANGSGSSNTDGSITSTVSANQDAGFSIVTYTGDLTAVGTSTIGHGLGVAPDFVIIKSLNTAYNWSVMSSALTSWNYNIYLNLQNAQASGAGNGSRSDPTSTVFSVNYDSNQGVNGTNYVAYCFAEIEGFSKFGSYTGNGSADGPFIYTGFRPAWIMFKRTDVANGWYIYDTARDTYNIANHTLYAYLSNAEYTGSSVGDILSNGFKQRNTEAAFNASGGTYIYMAFAENPFKYANAR